MVPSVVSECCAEERTIDHAVLHCPIHQPPCGVHGLTFPGDETIKWLLTPDLISSAAKDLIEKLLIR